MNHGYVLLALFVQTKRIELVTVQLMNRPDAGDVADACIKNAQQISFAPSIQQTSFATPIVA